MILDKAECLEWGFGNLLDNATRGVVAEYIVAKALGMAFGYRMEWDFADIRFRDCHIEVKSSAYVQSWQQVKPSVIQFDIAPRSNKWDAETNITIRSDPPKRHADVYIFCVFTEHDKSLANPLDTNQWAFYVTKTDTLDGRLGAQKSAALTTIQKLSASITYDELKNVVEHAISTMVPANNPQSP